MFGRKEVRRNFYSVRPQFLRNTEPDVNLFDKSVMLFAISQLFVGEEGLQSDDLESRRLASSIDVTSGLKKILSCRLPCLVELQNPNLRLQVHANVSMLYRTDKAISWHRHRRLQPLVRRLVAMQIALHVGVT